MIKFRLLTLAALSVLFMGASAPAMAYSGATRYASDYYGTRIALGDATDGTALYLTGTAGFCKVPGDDYEVFHRVIDAGWVTWDVLDTCKDELGNEFVRVTARNSYGWRSTTTFQTKGWNPLR